MPRSRWIKYEFFRDDVVAQLSHEARLTFIGLWCHADDEGRCADVPLLIKADVWPLDESIDAKQVDTWLKELAKYRLIIRYEVDGRKLIAVRNWKKHQSVPKARRSVYPPPPVGLLEDDGSPTVVVSGESSVSDSVSDRNLSVAPRRDLAFEALCSVASIDWTELTPSHRGAVNRALKEIRSVWKDEETLPAEIHRRAQFYLGTFPQAVLTPSALSRHWAECSVPNRGASSTSRLLALADEMEETDDKTYT
jgi:hypothetical protein